MKKCNFRENLCQVQNAYAAIIKSITARWLRITKSFICVPISALLGVHHQLTTCANCQSAYFPIKHPTTDQNWFPCCVLEHFQILDFLKAVNVWVRSAFGNIFTILTSALRRQSDIWSAKSLVCNDWLKKCTSYKSHSLHILVNTRFLYFVICLNLRRHPPPPIIIIWSHGKYA